MGLVWASTKTLTKREAQPSHSQTHNKSIRSIPEDPPPPPSRSAAAAAVVPEIFISLRHGNHSERCSCTEACVGNNPPYRSSWCRPPCATSWSSARLNLMAFCKDFNARTQKYKAETPMQVTLTAYKDSTFEFVVKSPSVSWFLKKAAGIETASGRPGHTVVSSLSLRHVYEIAKLKQSDPYCKHMSLEALCKSIIGTANSMGIEIVKDL
uniref:Large ribosomal subunit protein uL11m n=2 Tax=Oryza TaxID=4527 RepID=A0A0D3HEH7_9ORYZ